MTLSTPLVVEIKYRLGQVMILSLQVKVMIKLGVVKVMMFL